VNQLKFKSWLLILTVVIPACAGNSNTVAPPAVVGPPPTTVQSPGAAGNGSAPKIIGVKPRSLPASPAPSKDGLVTGISFGRFGTVAVYKPKTPTHVVLFLSGDGGWNQGVIDMAQMLYRKDYLVIGVDVPRYLAATAKGKESCIYPPADLQALTQVVLRRLGIRRYLRPLLVGYSSGATLAYAALAAAPAGTFDGAISLGFCPDIASRKPLCKGDGLASKPRRTTKKGVHRGYDVLPSRQLPSLWVALHGRVDQVCALKQTEAFVAASGNARLVALDLVGHGFGVQRRWQMEFERAVRDVSATAFVRRAQINTAQSRGRSTDTAKAAAPNLDDVDLPLVEVTAPPEASKTDYLAVLISGDGGWAGLDRDVADGLSEAGVPVIGLDSLQYFWSERTPDGSGADLQRLLTYYLNEWHKQKAIIIGYSFGADVLPFMVSRLSGATKTAVPLVALISPSAKASFEFQLAEWFDDDDAEDGQLVAPELAKLKELKRLCFFGANDHKALCPKLLGGVQAVKLPGGHRLSESSEGIAAVVLQAIGLHSAPEQ